ncbi:MAG: bacteriohemerythrin [Pseudomonadota bacterium]
MALIDWKDEFAIGIPAVDFEHRELIGLINELHAQLTQPGAPQDAVAAFLGEINVRIGAHFALEEKEMRERQYDQLAAHKADHERLLDEIRDLMDRYEDDQNFDEQELARRLRDWFVAHFGSHDARLHRYLAHG